MRLPIGPGLLLATAALAGCTDPYAWPGTWHPTQVNDVNLRAMVADPADLVWGASGTGTDGQLAAAAVERLRNGHAPPLPDASISKIGSSAPSAAQSLDLGAAAPAPQGGGR